MKCALPIVVLVMICTVNLYGAERPIDRGSITVGGTIYFVSSGGPLYEINKDHNALSFYVAPEFGYFVWKGILIGGTAEFADITRINEDYILFSIGPTVGAFFNTNSNKTKGAIYPYIKQSLFYKSVDWVGQDKYELISYNGKCGINYMISKAVAIDIGASFQMDFYKLGDNDNISGTIVRVGAGIQSFVF